MRGISPRLPPGHVLVGLVGSAGVGKDTAAAYLRNRHGFRCAAFADVLRDMLVPLVEAAGVSASWLTERELKEIPIQSIDISGRRLMQTLGTEWGRALRPDLWVILMARRLGLDYLPYVTPVSDRICITDVRFGNEATWIESLGGRIVRVTRSVRPVEDHESERHVDHLPSWSEVPNVGSLDELQQMLDRVADDLAVDARLRDGAAVR